MPPHDGIRSHDHKAVEPPRPGSSERDPEASVHVDDVGPWPLARQGGHLLAQDEVLQDEVRSRPGERPDDPDDDRDLKRMR